MSSSDIFIGETIGTAILILLGGGVCAAVTLKASKARNAGWLAITFGWGFAVLTAVYTSAPLSGAHLNPAVTIGIAVKDNAWGDVPTYFAGQLLGAMIGAALVWAAYAGQFHAHLTDKDIVGGPGAQATTAKAVEAQEKGAGPVLGVFSTGPEIRNVVQNLITEIIGTVVLVLRNASAVDKATKQETPLTAGQIQIQSEAAECFYRRMEIQPLKEFPAGLRKAAGL